MNDKCVIITGTVVPNVLIHGHEDLDIVERQNQYANAVVRRGKYLETLSFYTQVLDEPIYFLENSSYDFSVDSDFQNLFQKNNVNLVKFPMSQHAERGKGYQEFEMLDIFVRDISGRHQSFVKLSGRYQYQNIKTLVGFQPRGTMIDMHRKRKIAVTSILSTTFEFYEKHLMGLYLEADDRQGAWIERILYQKLRGKAFQQSVQLFPVKPDLIGWTRSGEDNAGSAITRLKHLVKNVERVILRRLGVNELYL
jgi:hypothetical protein